MWHGKTWSYLFLFDEDGQQSVDVFTICVEEKLTEHFVAKGGGLDATCE